LGDALKVEDPNEAVTIGRTGSHEGLCQKARGEKIALRGNEFRHRFIAGERQKLRCTLVLPIGEDTEAGVEIGADVPEEVEGKNILLVDDIYTSGATAQEASKALLKAGAEKVFVYTLARSVLK